MSSEAFLRCIREASAEGNTWWLDLGERKLLDSLPVPWRQVFAAS